VRRAGVAVLSRGDQELLQIAPVSVFQDHVVGFLLATQPDQFDDVLVTEFVQEIQMPFEFLQRDLVLRVRQTLHHHQGLLVAAVDLILCRVNLAEFAPAERLQLLQVASRRCDLVVIRFGLFGLIAALALSGVRAVALIMGITVLLLLIARRFVAGFL